MEILFGFEAEKTFYKIGDEVGVVFDNGSHYDGELEDIRVEERAITVAGVVLSLEQIVQIAHK